MIKFSNDDFAKLRYFFEKERDDIVST